MCGAGNKYSFLGLMAVNQPSLRVTEVCLHCHKSLTTMSLGFTTKDVKAQAFLFLILCEVSMLNIVMGLLWEHLEIFFAWSLHVPLSYCFTSFMCSWSWTSMFWRFGCMPEQHEQPKQPPYEQPDNILSLGKLWLIGELANYVWLHSP